MYSLAAIPASEYIEVLLGRSVGRDGKTTCPFHGGGQERTPSLHAYPDAGRGWFCFGCDEGGDIYTLGAKLYGLDVRQDFREIRRRLAADLLRAGEAA
jgi:DNA primase